MAIVPHLLFSIIYFIQPLAFVRNFKVVYTFSIFDQLKRIFFFVSIQKGMFNANGYLNTWYNSHIFTFWLQSKSIIINWHVSLVMVACFITNNNGFMCSPCMSIYIAHLSLIAWNKKKLFKNKCSLFQAPSVCFWIYINWGKFPFCHKGLDLSMNG